MIVVNPGGPCSSRTGSASGLGTPKPASEGPRPRTVTCLGALPVMIKPPISTSLPVSTRIRVEILRAWAEAGVGVGVVVGVAVGVSVGVGVGVGVPDVGVGVVVGVA